MKDVKKFLWRQGDLDTEDLKRLFQIRSNNIYLIFNLSDFKSIEKEFWGYSHQEC